jgi:DNA-binding beta-propeller fold protein YncE
MYPSRSRVPDERDDVAAPALCPHSLARTAARGRVVRPLLLASFAAGCLLIAAVATAGPTVAYTAYIANSGSGTITPINTATNATGSMPAINDPSAVAITPDRKTALVGNWNEGTVTPITLSTMTAGSPIAVGKSPSAIAITPDGTKAYVSNYHGNGPGTVTAITLSNDNTSTISVGRGPSAIAITPDGTMAYVANQFDGTLTPITIATDTAGTPIAVGLGGNVARTDAVAVSPDDTTVYAANYGSNSIVPVTVATDTARTAITGVTSPHAIAITPDGSTAYVAEDGTPGHVVPITLSNNSLGTPIAVGANPYAIAITPDQASAYVADYNNNGAGVVTPIALSTKTAGSAITVGNGPEAVAITPDQAPIASFTVTRGATGTANTFDASASSVAYGSITNYRWNFGDGTTLSTATPTTTHSYATAGSYTATLTETDSAGTSTSQVFTGQTMSRDGGPSAQTTRTLTINAGTTTTGTRGSSGSTGPTATPLAPPVLGVKFEARPHGVVLARTSPSGPLVRLSGPVDLPVGSLIDARHGTISLVMAMSGRRTQTATLWSGTFVVHQRRGGHGMTEFSLAGGTFSRCPRSARAGSVHLATAATSGGHGSVRSLWAKDNHGRFSTRGQNSVATVRGTRWQTIDRCDGTLTAVSKGTVGVRVAGGHSTVVVTAGHSYLAKSRR